MPVKIRNTFNCPVECALEILGGKWKPVILAHLKEGAKRYRDLRRLIPKLSDKMLSQRLAELEELGFISRATSEYVLTERGESLRSVLQALHDWGLRASVDFGVLIEDRAADKGARPPSTHPK